MLSGAQNDFKRISEPWKKIHVPKYFELFFIIIINEKKIIIPPDRINKLISRVCFKSLRDLVHIDSIAQFSVYFPTDIASQTQSFFSDGSATSSVSKHFKQNRKVSFYFYTRFYFGDPPHVSCKRDNLSWLSCPSKKLVSFFFFFSLSFYYA